MCEITSVRVIVDDFYGDPETVGYVYEYDDGVAVVSIVDDNNHVIDGDTFEHGVTRAAIVRGFFDEFYGRYIHTRRA